MGLGLRAVVFVRLAAVFFLPAALRADFLAGLRLAADFFFAADFLAGFFFFAPLADDFFDFFFALAIKVWSLLVNEISHTHRVESMLKQRHVEFVIRVDR